MNYELIVHCWMESSLTLGITVSFCYTLHYSQLPRAKHGKAFTKGYINPNTTNHCPLNSEDARTNYPARVPLPPHAQLLFVLRNDM